MLMAGATVDVAGPLLKNLRDDHALGNDKYPATVEDALQVLLLCKKESKKGYDDGSGKTAASFMQSSGRGPKCWKCGSFGHLKRDCPGEKEAKKGDQSHFQEKSAWSF